MYLDQLDGSAKLTSWMDQLDRPAGRTSWTDQFFLFEALASSHIRRFSSQFVHCGSFRVRRRPCFITIFLAALLHAVSRMTGILSVGLCCKEFRLSSHKAHDQSHKSWLQNQAVTIPGRVAAFLAGNLHRFTGNFCYYPQVCYIHELID